MNSSPLSRPLIRALFALFFVFGLAAQSQAAKTSLDISPASYSPEQTQIELSDAIEPGALVYSKTIKIQYQLLDHRKNRFYSNGQPNYLHSFFGNHSFSCGGNLSGIYGVKWRMRFEGEKRDVTCGTAGLAVATNRCDRDACLAETSVTIELYRSQGPIRVGRNVKFPGIRFSGPSRWLGDLGDGFKLQVDQPEVVLNHTQGDTRVSFSSLE